MTTEEKISELYRLVYELQEEIADLKRKKTRCFTPPTFEEVKAYCLERNNGVNPQAFLDHYETNGWIRGKTKIKDWKACVRTWEKNEKPQENKIHYIAE